MPLVTHPRGTGPSLAPLALVKQVDVPLGRLQVEPSGLRAKVQLMSLHRRPGLCLTDGQMSDVALHRIEDVEYVDAHIGIEVGVDQPVYWHGSGR